MAMSSRGRTRVEPTAEGMQAQLAGVDTFDSTDVLMVWQIPYHGAMNREGIAEGSSTGSGYTHPRTTHRPERTNRGHVPQ